MAPTATRDSVGRGADQGRAATAGTAQRSIRGAWLCWLSTRMCAPVGAIEAPLPPLVEPAQRLLLDRLGTASKSRLR